MPEVTFQGGQKIETLANVNAILVSEGVTALFIKEDRVKLPNNKRNNLFARAIYQKQKKYELLNLNI